ncbi:MAG: hypothetical protein A4E32_00793 [Methanomassiliicoccales archaeon PtaU1.Bin124]|nr:MAG: hypothetical protein A4E32_00793 [Methanomassiliicoccales archaeon PtaU1.Bin124]
MVDENSFLLYLQSERNYYNDLGNSNRNILSGLIATGIASLVSLLILLKEGQFGFGKEIQFDDIIPYYTSVLFISFGLNLLFIWYNSKRESDLIDYSSSDLRKEVFKMEPGVVLGFLSIALGIISLIYVMYKIFSGDGIIGFYISIIIFITVTIFIILIIGRKILENYGFEHIGSATFKMASKNLFIYPIIIFSLGLGILLLIFYPIDPLINKINIFIFSIYLVEIQIILINCLKYYSRCVKYHFIRDQIIDLSNNLIMNKMSYEEAKLKYGEIVKKNIFGKI